MSDREVFYTGTSLLVVYELEVLKWMEWAYSYWEQFCSLYSLLLYMLLWVWLPKRSSDGDLRAVLTNLQLKLFTFLYLPRNWVMNRVGGLEAEDSGV